MNKVLITDKVHELMPQRLKNLGYEVDYDISINNLLLKNRIQEYSGIVINSKITMNKEMIDLGSQLKWIARLGSGMEIIDVAYCKKKKIKVVNAPEGNCHAVAEHEIGMLLALNNNLLRANRQLREYNWQRESNRGKELRGKTLGIIGLGYTGSALAEKLSPWGLSVISYDKYRKRYSSSLRFVEKVCQEELILRADIISLHLPLTEETTFLINESFINKCKDGVIISNTSRGKIVKTIELIEALKSGKVGGACLDVFENENPNTFTEDEIKMYDELFEMENVVLSPHIAGWTKESLSLISTTILDKLFLK